jgi:hypothetical protein
MPHESMTSMELAAPHDEAKAPESTSLILTPKAPFLCSIRNSRFSP